MSLEMVLLILLVSQMIGMSVFAAFETEASIPARLSKWIFINGGTIGLYYAVGGWSLLLPGFMLVLGLTVHFIICRKYGFHPIYATPRRRYYEFRGWAWPE